MTLTHRLRRAKQRQNIIALGFWNVGSPYRWVSSGRHDPYTADVYFAQREDGLIKIGVSNTPDLRVRTLKLTLLAVIPSVGRFEGYLHHYFEGFHEEGEWFRPEPPLLTFIDRVNATFPFWSLAA